MKKLLLILALALTLTANMAKADDFSDGLEAYFDGDYTTALKLLKPLAETGHAAAQYNLALKYENGEGVLQDYKEAASLYRMAAEQGYATAQLNLGWMYDNGYGLLQDHKRAHMWFNIARSNGEKEYAGDNIEILSRSMTLSDISKAQEMARRCVDSGYQDC
jgi:TPR repeat protein